MKPSHSPACHQLALRQPQITMSQGSQKEGFSLVQTPVFVSTSFSSSHLFNTNYELSNGMFSMDLSERGAVSSMRGAMTAGASSQGVPVQGGAEPQI